MSITLTEEKLNEVSEIFVFDSTGKKVRFGDVFATQKTIVIFIRHFFCGQCQEYTSLIAKIPQSALEEAQCKIVIIGCGQSALIDNYKKDTGFKGELYADPTRSMYKKLGMIENIAGTPSGEPKKSYVKAALPVTIASIANGLKNPFHIGKQGNFSQLGGEYILGPGKQCLFSRNMKHSEDHMEITDLMKEAGINYAPA